MPIRKVMEEMWPSPVARKAENESQSAGRQVSLIRVRNDRRIEKRGGFQRVFGQEIGTDQEASLLGKLRHPSTASRATCSNRSRKRLRIC